MSCSGRTHPQNSPRARLEVNLGPRLRGDDVCGRCCECHLRHSRGGGSPVHLARWVNPLLQRERRGRFVKCLEAPANCGWQGQADNCMDPRPSARRRWRRGLSGMTDAVRTAFRKCRPAASASRGGWDTSGRRGSTPDQVRGRLGSPRGAGRRLTGKAGACPGNICRRLIYPRTPRGVGSSALPRVTRRCLRGVPSSACDARVAFDQPGLAGR
jgi:hypothetical protein